MITESSGKGTAQRNPEEGGGERGEGGREGKEEAMVLEKEREGYEEQAMVFAFLVVA